LNLKELVNWFEAGSLDGAAQVVESHRKGSQAHFSVVLCVNMQRKIKTSKQRPARGPAA
jgi:hypothetical protein